MSTPQDKLAEEVYYTQELLSDVFAKPIAQLMQESAEKYILEGKFNNLVPTIQTSMRALWFRAMYAGIVDAEKEIDNNTTKISLSANLSDVIEFGKKKDPQIARIDGELKDLNKYKEEASTLADLEDIQRRIDLLQIEKDLVNNPNGSPMSRRLGEKISLENELNEAKKKKDFGRVTAIRQELSARRFQDQPKPVEPKTKKTKATPQTKKVKQAEQEQAPEVKQNRKRIITTKEQIRREVTSGRRSVRDDVLVINPERKAEVRLRDLLSFDPNADMEKDPWDNLFFPVQSTSDAKSNADIRLRATNSLQMYATLNEKYPAISQKSMFAEQYLNRRQEVVATSLQEQYQEKIKDVVGKYIEQDKTSISTEESTLKRIRKVYQSDKKDRYSAFVNNLKSKINYTEETPTKYIERLKAELKEITPKEKTPQQRALEERFNKLNNIEQTLNSRRENLLLSVDARERAKLIKSPSFIDLTNRLDEAQKRLGRVEKELEDFTPKQALQLRQKLEQAQRDIKEGKNIETRKIYDPINLSKEEKEMLIKLGGYAPSQRLLNLQNKLEKMSVGQARDKVMAQYKAQAAREKYPINLADNIRAQKTFTAAQINGYVKDLKREGGRFDDELYQISARTASTEVAAAYGIGRLQTYLDRGVKYVQWIATMDARTSVFCQSLHRKIFAVRDLIPAAMAKQTFPKTRLPEYAPENNSIKNMMGINIWAPPAHPYCRSFLSPIYTDESMDKYPPGGFPPDQELNQYLLAGMKDKKGRVPFDRLTRDEKEVALEDIVQSQNKMRESKLKKILRSMGEMQDIFNSGLSYLTRKMKQDEVATFTVDEIKRNDSMLVNALLGGTAVLGTGAMMYFFMKSNLGQALQDYIKTSVGDVVVGTLSQEAIRRLLGNLVKTSKELNNLPDSVKNLLPSPTDLNDVSTANKIEAVNSLGEVGYEMASLGNIDNIGNLVSSGQVQGLSPQAPKAVVTRAIYNQILQKRSELTNRMDTIMSQAMRNKGGSIQPSDIIKIEEWANTYAIQVRGKGQTFVSKKIFDEMMANPVVRSEIDRLQDEINQFERASQGLEQYDDGDVISDSIRQANRLEYQRLKGNIRSLREKVLNRDVIKPNVTLPEALPEVNDILNQTIATESRYSDALDSLFNEFRSELTRNIPRELQRGFIPESINSIEELKEVQKVIKNGLSEVGRDFLDTKKKGKPSYTPLTAARKRGLDTDLSEALLDLENLELRLETNGLQYKSSVAELNEHYKSRINTELRMILDLEFRISNRIKELSE